MTIHVVGGGRRTVQDDLADRPVWMSQRWRNAFARGAMSGRVGCDARRRLSLGIEW